MFINIKQRSEKMLDLLFAGPDPYVNVLLLPAKNVHHVVTFSWEICNLFCNVVLHPWWLFHGIHRLFESFCCKDLQFHHLSHKKTKIFQTIHEKLNLHKVVSVRFSRRGCPSGVIQPQSLWSRQSFCRSAAHLLRWSWTARFWRTWAWWTSSGERVCLLQLEAQIVSKVGG